MTPGTSEWLDSCLKPPFERDNLLDDSMLEAVEEEPLTSPSPAEEVGLLGDEPEPKEVQTTTLHAPKDLKRLLSLRETSVQG